jgi:hypothetical protein
MEEIRGALASAVRSRFLMVARLLRLVRSLELVRY